MIFTKKTTSLRLSLQKTLSLLLGILMVLYSPINIFYLNTPIIGFIEIGISLYSFYCFWAATSGRVKTVQYYTLAGLTTFLIYFAAYHADIRGFSILWGLTLPIIYYIMFGSKQGFYFTLVALFPSLYVIFYHLPSDFFISYRAMTNYSLAHFFIWSLCHLYEKQHYQDKNQLHKMALNDALTGVKNRHALEKCFDKLEQHSAQANVLLVDIDFFKRVNDQFGHGIGDYVLVEVAECLQNHVDSNAVYRLGGEEFVIVLDKQSHQEAQHKAEEIRHAIEHYIFHNHDLRLRLTVSIGVACSSPGGRMNDALRLADIKLYQAKNAGRNAVCV
ncbi:MAG: GGDEF domain-containing protein [Marinomonas sp.]|uniref:GGDEF domain-containing protein n=1 Tax=Marinomonas sp. TaxID=1904862 RepID=UPI003C73003A